VHGNGILASSWFALFRRHRSAPVSDLHTAKCAEFPAVPAEDSRTKHHCSVTSTAMGWGKGKGRKGGDGKGHRNRS